MQIIRFMTKANKPAFGTGYGGHPNPCLLFILPPGICWKHGSKSLVVWKTGWPQKKRMHLEIKCKNAREEGDETSRAFMERQGQLGRGYWRYPLPCPGQLPLPPLLPIPPHPPRPPMPATFSSGAIFLAAS